ncbi:MAG: methyltransferase domain-containing protein [Candidatus Omnitrophica bacterium]|nr:methyltransferase domain-containing protein [Candidatus Omnitrophota bacterium]
MTSSYYQRRECRICNSDNLRLVLPLVPTPSGDKYLTESQRSIPQEPVPLDLYQCAVCGLVQLPYVIHPDALYGDYIYETSISLGLTKHFRGYAEEVAGNLRLDRGDLVVDIGSNDGTLLGHFRDLGLQVLGVEPSPASAKAQHLGIDTKVGYFGEVLSRDIRNAVGPAMAITANNVFANIDNLDDVLKSFLPETIFHEHLSYFSLGSLMVLFERHGMQVFDATRVATKGGSLRGFVQLTEAGRPVSNRVAQLLAIEHALGTSNPGVFSAFSATLAATKHRLSILLEELRGSGKSIVGYGASVGVTTLLYQFDIAGFLDYLVDDNTAKHFRFSPGSQLPVLPSDVLYERKPDYALILAWAYADPIIARHRHFLDGGGHFVIPLPDLTVI